MKKYITLFLLVLIALPAMAVEKQQVLYEGGTTGGAAPWIIGRLNTSAQDSLVFQYASGKLAIPYAAIDSFDYTTEVAHHLGVVPAIAIGMLKRRERKHIFRIAYRDPNDKSQVAIFEVSKQMAPPLNGILEVQVHKNKTSLRSSTK